MSPFESGHEDHLEKGPFNGMMFPSGGSSSPVSQAHHTLTTAPRVATAVEFEVKLVKTAKQSSLGLNVDLSDGGVIYVEAIGKGLIQDWNLANAENQVRLRDKIVSVNGQRGSANAMVQACKEEDVLNLVILREATP
eukprot:CAMPEP_0178370730 /NCGR_PEP_ID=MMETSP0689_2-20121128/458_1 /TAXON_ID=160604 /ORGANISM="Amphidinium massartii, Strain CS-259" /LENGTH=136 /DNA_ID=CAMNT_0019990571 /DNA_START=92 /DNA_END=502 /DNA_ORIENTATION=+